MTKKDVLGVTGADGSITPILVLLKKNYAMVF